MKKKYQIKIPKFISVYYSDVNNILLVQGPISQKLIPLKLKLKIEITNSLIIVTDQFFIDDVSNREKKRKKVFLGTCVANIKQALLEVSKSKYKKLKLVGVGYKIQIVQYKNKELIKFNLGFSHTIYYKIPKTIQIVCYNTNKFILLGYDYRLITQIASKLRSYKIPEVYKGKGILYENELIKLKEGKKI